LVLYLLVSAHLIILIVCKDKVGNTFVFHFKSTTKRRVLKDVKVCLGSFEVRSPLPVERTTKAKRRKQKINNVEQKQKNKYQVHCCEK